MHYTYERKYKGKLDEKEGKNRQEIRKPLTSIQYFALK